MPPFVQNITLLRLCPRTRFNLYRVFSISRATFINTLFFTCLIWGHSAQADNTKDQDKSQLDDQADTVVVGQSKHSAVLQGRAASVIDEKALKEQVVRSVPEALGDEIGAYVQQTAHGQGSVYLRGRTGRHTLLIIDGFRLNHALFRQGPNQYLFTIDPLGLERIEVLRGGGSVVLGANALSGSILVHSKDPKIDPYHEGIKLQSSFTGLYATADLSQGVRSELNAQINSSWGLYLSASWLKREELEASDPLKLRQDIPQVLILEKNVPRFRENQRLQMGTGYEALGADFVSRVKLQHGEWKVAARLFRQYDTPRTDQCPPPEAPESWCLNYDEQFRTHIYSVLEQNFKQAWAQDLWVGFSFQRQHERRTNDRENYLNIGRDSVNVWELRTKVTTKKWVRNQQQFQLNYGFDSTFEQVSSKAWDTLVLSNITREKTRGQYMDGSDYLRAGLWTQAQWTYQDLSLRLGSRVNGVQARSPEDKQSETSSIKRQWLGSTSALGLTWQVTPTWAFLSNLEEGYAPPNLDDLTARQLTGQGYQIENPNLEAEYSLSFELGTKFSSAQSLRSKKLGFSFELWGFIQELKQGIERRDAVCPSTERSCLAARISTPFTLVNLAEPAHIYGIEQQFTLSLPLRITVSEYASYALGTGPSPLSSEAGKSRPLSRIPPLNGGVKVRWESRLQRFYAQVGLRWAQAQSLLSFGDEIDHRIPYGGTPAYQVYHAQLGFREGGWSLNLNLENLSDVAYRVHGSSVNGAARGLSMFLTYQL